VHYAAEEGHLHAVELLIDQMEPSAIWNPVADQVGEGEAGSEMWTQATTECLCLLILYMVVGNACTHTQAHMHTHTHSQIDTCT